jgi:hypothetical protein
MNVYLTGGAVRDTITGRPIRDLDFTVQGNALKLQKDLERAGAEVVAVGVPPLPDQFKRADEGGMLLEEAGRAGAAAADFGRLSTTRGQGFQGETYATPDQLNCQGHLLLAKLLLSALTNP